MPIPSFTFIQGEGGLSISSLAPRRGDSGADPVFPNEVPMFQGADSTLFGDVDDAAYNSVNNVEADASWFNAPLGSWSFNTVPVVVVDAKSGNPPSGSGITTADWTAMTISQRAIHFIDNHPNKGAVTHFQIDMGDGAFQSLIDLEDYTSLELLHINNLQFEGIPGPGDSHVGIKGPNIAIPPTVQCGGHLSINANGNATSLEFSGVEFFSPSFINVHLPPGGNGNFGNASFVAKQDLQIDIATGATANNAPVTGAFPLGSLTSAPQFMSIAGNMSLRPGGVYHGLYMNPAADAPITGWTPYDSDSTPLVINGVFVGRHSANDANADYRNNGSAWGANSSATGTARAGWFNPLNTANTPTARMGDYIVGTTGDPNGGTSNERIDSVALLSGRFVRDYGDLIFNASGSGSGGWSTDNNPLPDAFSGFSIGAR
jgi:hypothetical protein